MLTCKDSIIQKKTLHNIKELCCFLSLCAKPPTPDSAKEFLSTPTNTSQAHREGGGDEGERPWEASPSGAPSWHRSRNWAPPRRLPDCQGTRPLSQELPKVSFLKKEHISCIADKKTKAQEVKRPIQWTNVFLGQKMSLSTP